MSAAGVAPILEWELPFRGLQGAAYGVRQPVLLGRLRVPQGGDLTAVDAALPATLLRFLPPYTAPSGATDAAMGLALRVLGWSAAIQAAAGLPVFETGRIIAHDPTEASSPVLTLALAAAPQQHDAAILAAQWAAQAIRQILHAGAAAAELSHPAQALISRLVTLAPPGNNTLRFLRAARALDIPWTRVVDNTYQFGWSQHSSWLDSSFTERSGAIAARLSRNKVAAAQVLRRAGLPVPTHALAASADAAERIAASLGYPVVVKPADRDGGVGVAAGLRTAEAVRKAYAVARRVSAQVLVEQHVEGQDYRLTVLDGRLIWAVQRISAGVTGDGRATVSELVQRANADPHRGLGAQFPLRPLKLDEEALELLAEQGAAPEAVPAAAAFLRLRRAANIASGGVPVAVTDRVHPDNRRLAERAARALRLDVAGIDLLIADIARSWRQSGAAICEINGQPGLGSMTAQHLHAEVLRARVSGDGRIPLVLVLGLQAAEIAKALQRRWRAVGLHAALADAAPGRGLHASVQALLADTQIQAVVAVADASILGSGLPFDCCDALALAGAWTADTARIVQMLAPHARTALIADSESAEYFERYARYAPMPAVRVATGLPASAPEPAAAMDALAAAIVAACRRDAAAAAGISTPTAC